LNVRVALSDHCGKIGLAALAGLGGGAQMRSVSTRLSVAMRELSRLAGLHFLKLLCA